MNSSIIKSDLQFNEKKIEKGMVVEPFFEGRELTIGYIQTLEGWMHLPILELKPKKEFYDYEAKYTKGLTDFILPANLSPEKTKELQGKGEECLIACGVEGYARVDFLYNGNDYVVLEINTLPGMTETSDVPAQASSIGVDFNELVKQLVSSALLKV